MLVDNLCQEKDKQIEKMKREMLGSNLEITQAFFLMSFPHLVQKVNGEVQLPPGASTAVAR